MFFPPAATARIETMELRKKLYAAYLAKGPAYRPRTLHLREDGTPRHINRLILEDSPYLLQHAHNPVDWYPWSPEAFEHARREQKPVFLSIGYATCHWCHVMEQESFEESAVAELLNTHFVAIKVDRESHPDVDQIYMTAVMLFTGRGGWPMSSFLTPEGRPFFGGTYFPPGPFTDLLRQVARAWRERRDEVETQAGNIARAVAENNRLDGRRGTLDPDIAERTVALLGESFDEVHGGFGLAPKFPQEPWLFLLLDQAERRGDARALEMLETTLGQMAQGGIHDQVGGGFHRYSTDYEWLVPHFEKMLYNQAQLSRVYLAAWRLTRKARYRRLATRTLGYVLREMSAPEGGFYSASDADSEGEEGRFFTWTLAEFRAVLTPQEAELAKSIYGLSRIGNFEGRNIPHLERSLEREAANRKLDEETLSRRLDQINFKLYQARGRRIAPLRDDKIITAWNGMMITAFAEAADRLGEPAYRQAAERAAEFLWRHNHPSPGRLWRVHLEGRSSVAATLEDYAYLGEAMLALYGLTAARTWLERAGELAAALLHRFSDREGGGFYLNEAEAGITAMDRPHDDGADGAIPSGSSVALRLLQGLWLRTGEQRYHRYAQELIGRFATAIERQPQAYGYMLTAIENLREGELGARNYSAAGNIRLSGQVLAEADGGLRLRVEIEIPPGWHINSGRPGNPVSAATCLALAPGSDGWSLGKVDYPEGSLHKLAFQEQPISLYTGTVLLQAPLRHNNTLPPGGTLPVHLRLQACNEAVCLAPEHSTLRLSLPGMAVS